MRVGSPPVTMKLPKNRKLPSGPQTVGPLHLGLTPILYGLSLRGRAVVPFHPKNRAMFRATFLLAFLALIFVVTVSACFALLQHLQRPMAHRPAINAPL